MSELTEENPSISVYDWCNFAIDFYQVRSSDGEELESATRALLAMNERSGSVLREPSLGKKSEFLVTRCSHALRGSLEETMNKFGCVALYPFVFERGWTRIKGIALDEGGLARMFSKLGQRGELRVDAKSKFDLSLFRENFVVPTAALAHGMTAKQAESLLTAVESGYYSVPRKVGFGEVAKRLRVPRTTYEEHVRKAESKVMNAAAPYLSLYFGRPARVRKSGARHQGEPVFSRNRGQERHALA